jgi:uncharacterized protein YkwD
MQGKLMRSMACLNGISEVALLVVGCFSCCMALAGSYKDYATALVQGLPAGSSFRADLEAELSTLASSYRVTQGKPPLKSNPMFILAARAQAADMMLHNFVGHRASTGQDFDSRMRAFVGDVTRFPALAENAANETRSTPADDAKARALFQEWLDSPPHKKNLRSLDYQFVSTGVVQRGNTLWAVQIFWATPREHGLFAN